MPTTDNLLDAYNALLSRHPLFAAKGLLRHRKALQATFWARIAWGKSAQTAASASAGPARLNAERVAHKNEDLYTRASLALRDALDELALPPAKRTAIEQELSSQFTRKI